MIYSTPHTAWPLAENPADEWAADEWLDDPSCYQDYQQWADGGLSEAEYRAADQRFLLAYRAILQGDQPLRSDSLTQEAQALGLVLELSHDWRTPEPKPRGIPDAHIAQIAEDLVPDSPLLAERILGPYTVGCSRALFISAVAGTSLFYTLANESNPIERFRKARPRPDLHDRMAVGGFSMAPAMLWDADWRPLLPLHHTWLPTGPVHADITPLSQGGPYTLARLTPLQDGSWHANMAIGLRWAPSTDWLTRRMRIELLRFRRHDRRANWETLLRGRGEVLYRSCAIWNWIQENRP